MSESDHDTLLTPRQVSEIVGVVPETIREWLRKGILSGIHLGRLWRVKRSELATFLGTVPPLTDRVLKQRADAAMARMRKDGLL